MVTEDLFFRVKQPALVQAVHEIVNYQTCRTPERGIGSSAENITFRAHRASFFALLLTYRLRTAKRDASPAISAFRRYAHTPIRRHASFVVAAIPRGDPRDLLFKSFLAGNEFVGYPCV